MSWTNTFAGTLQLATTIACKRAAEFIFEVEVKIIGLEGPIRWIRSHSESCRKSGASPLAPNLIILRSPRPPISALAVPDLSPPPFVVAFFISWRGLTRSDIHSTGPSMALHLRSAQATH